MGAVLLCLSAVAQTTSTQAANGEEPPQKTAADYPNEPYLHEYAHGVMRYENDGSGTRDVRAMMRVPPLHSNEPSFWTPRAAC